MCDAQVDLPDLLGGEQLPVAAIDHVEEAVLRRVQQHLARRAVDREIGQHDVHARVVVPALARNGLVVPLVLPGVGVERDDRAQEQVVAAAGAADLPVPRRAVAGADQHLVELGVVGDAVPGVAAAAELPPLAGPGLRGHLHGLVLEAVGGIAGHHPEAPRELARVRVVRGQIAARGRDLGAAVADDHLAVEHLRRAGDVERLLGVDGLHFPELRAVLRVESDQAPVDRGDDHLAVPVGEPATDVPHHAEPIAGVLDRLRVVLQSSLPVFASTACTRL